MRVVGITGGIASGKSTATQIIKQAGIPVLDADVMANHLMDPGQVGWQSVVQHFGSDYLTPQGQIDRVKLGQLVFSQPQARKQLDGLIHPLVRQEILAEIEVYRSQGQKVLILDVPLLFEAGFDDLCDQVILVALDQDLQVARLMARNNLTKQEALKRIASQWSLDQKKELADLVWDNNGTKEDLARQVHSWLLSNS